VLDPCRVGQVVTIRLYGLVVVSGRNPLCSQCGCSEWEELSDTQIRCVECGLGATRGTLQVFRSDASYDPMSEDARRERERTARQRSVHNQRVFDAASFAPYGLDARWSGLRWFGGHSESNGRVTVFTRPWGQSVAAHHTTGPGRDLPHRVGRKSSDVPESRAELLA